MRKEKGLSPAAQEVLRQRYDRRGKKVSTKAGRKGLRCGRGWISADKDCNPQEATRPQPGRRLPPLQKSPGQASPLLLPTPGSRQSGFLSERSSLEETGQGVQGAAPDPAFEYPSNIERLDYSDYPSRRDSDHPGTAATIERVEDEIRHEKVEWLVAIDPSTGEEVFRVTDNSTNSVGLEDHPEESEILQSYKKNGQSLIFTHNHPESVALSDADISICISQPIEREIRACTSDGKSYCFTPSDGKLGDRDRRDMGADFDTWVELKMDRAGERVRKRVLEEGDSDLSRIEKEEVHRALLEAGSSTVEEWQDYGARYAVVEKKRIDSRPRILRHPKDPMLSPLRDKRKSFDSGISTKGVSPQQVLALVSVLLKRSYGPSIKEIRVHENKDGKIKGRFADRTRIMEFMISDKAVTTRMVKSLVGKGDSVYYEDSIEDEDDRFDATKSGSRGIKCGKGWISARKTCQIGISQITSPRERQQLALALASPDDRGTSPSVEDNPNSTIRDLQAEAKRQRIPYANRLTKEQLRDTIRAFKASPQQREVTYKALSKRKQAEESITNSQFAKDWTTANKILKLAGSGGVISAVAVAAIFANRTVQEVERAQASYAENFQTGAVQAKSKGQILAASAEPLSATQHHALFIVGGAKAEEGRAEDIEAEMLRLAQEEQADRQRRAANGEEVTDYDYPFADYLANPEVTRRQLFNPTKTDFDVPDSEKYDQDGKYRPEYLARLGIEGAALGRPDLGIKSAIIDRITGGKPKGGNEDAVDIAAQIYAHANAIRPSQQSLAGMEPSQLWEEVRAINKTMPSDSQYEVPSTKKGQTSQTDLQRAREWLTTKGWVGSTTPNKEKPIRIVAYGHGGKAVKEAMELLHAMGDPDRRILDQVTVTYISTPDFNFTQTRTKEASFVSNQDPFSRFSHRNVERVVGGEQGEPRSVKNYFSSANFRNEFTTWMGFGTWSRNQRVAEAQAKESKARERAAQAAQTRKQNSGGQQGQQSQQGSTGASAAPASTPAATPPPKKKRKKKSPAASQSSP